MILTLAQMISQATTLAGGRLDWTPSEVSFYVNQGVAYIALNSSVQHRSLESSYATTIASGVSRMRLPSDYNWPAALSLGSSVPSASTQWRTLTKTDIGRADVAAGRLDATQRPEMYVEYGDAAFEIVPSPNSSYSLVLRYQRQPAEMTASSATCELNMQWHWAAVLKATELLAMSRGDYELEQVCRNRYIDYMSTLLPDQDKKWMDARGAQWPRPAAQIGAARL